MRCLILMWNPKEIGHVLYRFDKTLSFPEEFATDGVFVALVNDGECIADGAETAAHAGPGYILFFGGATRMIPVASSCKISICELRGSAAVGLAQVGAHSLKALSHPRAAVLAERLCRGEGEASAAECFGLVCALYEAAQQADHELPPLVVAAMAQIRVNYSGLYGVEELSNNLGVSKSHLIRCFSAALKKTPGEYLTEVRIDAAKQLLASPDYTLDIISGLCGFSGANYLCRVFRQKVGCSPAQYRRMMAAISPRTVLPQEQHLYV